MLLIEDLRVGSLLLKDNEPHKLSRFEIGRCDYVNMKPIPLTYAILSNSGFAKTKYGFSFGSFRLVETVAVGGSIFYHNASDKKIKTVHELQLVYYAITGDEIKVRVEKHEFEIH